MIGESRDEVNTAKAQAASVGQAVTNLEQVMGAKHNESRTSSNAAFEAIISRINAIETALTQLPGQQREQSPLPQQPGLNPNAQQPGLNQNYSGQGQDRFPSAGTPHSFMPGGSAGPAPFGSARTHGTDPQQPGEPSGRAAFGGAYSQQPRSGDANHQPDRREQLPHNFFVGDRDSRWKFEDRVATAEYMRYPANGQALAWIKLTKNTS